MTIGHRTNAIFRDVVSDALDLEIDAIASGGDRLQDRRLAGTFGGDELVVCELRRLLEFNGRADHYEVGAYHNALLHAVVPSHIEVLNDMHPDERLMVLCGGRYSVREIDVEAFVDVFFDDTDFALPSDVVNALSDAGKGVLGLDDAVFGVANALPPHADELRPRPGRPHALAEIVEVTAQVEDRLRSRHKATPGAVWSEVAEMGFLYRRDEVFPYWPAWLDDAPA